MVEPARTHGPTQDERVASVREDKPDTVKPPSQVLVGPVAEVVAQIELGGVEPEPRELRDELRRLLRARTGIARPRRS